MKKLVYKLITGSLMLFMLSFGLAYAQSGVDSDSSIVNREDVILKIKNRITEMKALHESLKDQIDNGEITKEEAITSWKEALQKIREEKKLAFDGLMEKIKEKFSKIREKNSELADKLQVKFDEAQSRRAEISLKRIELAKMLRSGEITKEEAQERRKEDLSNFRTKILDAKRHNKSFGGRDDKDDSDGDIGNDIDDNKEDIE